MLTKAAPVAQSAETIQPRNDDQAPPLSFAQQRLWFLAQLDAQANLAYLLPNALRLRGRLDRDALRQALNRIVARHETLRTRIALHQDAPVQRIDAEDVGFPLQEHDLSVSPDPEAQARHLAELETTTAFDLAQDTLARGQLLRLGDDDHVLLITLHHLVSDGWSMGLLVHELTTLYAAFAQGQPDPLPPLQLQYADIAVWQRCRITGEVLQRQRDFWLEHLKDAPALLELPTDRPRPPVQNYHGDSFDITLAPALTAALRALSRRHGTTLFMTMLAAWGMLLARLSGQDHVVIGTPVANRTRSELEPLIGFFVNTQALCLDLRDNPSVAQVLAQVRSTALAAQDHQDLPFEQVIEALRPERNLSYPPVFQVILAWQSTPGSELALPGLHLSPMDSTVRDAKFDIDLSLREDDDRIVGSISYATALFERSTLERWMDHWRHLLHGMVAEGADVRAVNRLPLLSAAERDHVLKQWNATATDYPRDASVHALFEAQVVRDPSAIAVMHGDVALSYGELNTRANRLAHHLHRLGVRPDDRVAICLERSAEMVVAMVAVLKAGGAYVPLDPTYPPERLTLLLTDCSAVAVLAVMDTKLPETLEVLRVNLDDTALNEVSSDNPQSLSHGGTSAYVIYTSGSTGLPKGVEIPHRGISRLVLNNGYLPFDPSDRIAFAANPSFDAITMEVWGALLNGARMVVIDADVVLNPQRFAETIEREGISVLFIVTALFRQYADSMKAGFARLRYLLMGGEVIDPSVVARLLDGGGPQHFVHCYGPTETTTFATTYEVAAVENDLRRLPIGGPIANTQIYILDADGAPVPIGVAGELYIGGDGVARGYLNRDDLSAERFIADPFSGTPGARMYRSGDRGRWRADGMIEFVERNDHQVKIRGFRIELGEIEARLGAHAAVRECVVVALEDAAGSGKRLVAYWVGAEGATSDGVDAEALRGWLAATLPEYMVPAAYVALEALPLTPNGKLDRKALPAPDGAAYATTAYEAPQGAIEEAITAIWCDLLGLDTIGRHDNFFTLGGHSLLAVTLTERMRRQGLQADLRTLFATPTLAALAAAIGSVSVRVPPNGITPDSAAIRPQMLPLVALTQAQIDAIVAMTPGGVANVQDIYPLAPLQEGIFFHHLLQREGDAYLLPHLIAFDSRARLDGFVAALQRVIDRHDILRTAVVWEGLVEPVQVVWRHAPLLIEEVQLEDADGDAATQLQSRFDPQHWRMDVRQAPLMRGFAAHDPASGQWLLSLLCHHLALDHTTLEIALEEVNSHLRGDADRLPAPQPFRHFVAQALLGVSRAEHEAYFRTLLGDVEEPCAPFGLLDVQGDGSTVEEAQRVLPEQLSALLRRQARTLGVSVASLFHLAWAQVVARATGRASAVFGTVLFGRMQGGAGADRALGLFINTLPLRIEVDGTGVVDSVRVVQQRLAALLRHEHAPLSLAQQCSGVAAPAPLFTSLLNYRHSVEATDAVGSGSWEGIQTLSAQERTNYPLTVSVDDWGPGFTLKVHSQHPLVPARIVAFLEKALEELAEALAHAPETAVNALDVLPQAERDQVLRQWNATAADYPRDACVHELFEAQVARDPSAIAVTQAEVSLTYRELNARANRLAHYLRGLGVGPDDRVAICLERSVEMVVAVLAVLKAGGAYVPLDPHYPPERLSHMLADSGAVAVLTDMASRHLVEHRADAAVIVDLSANGERWAHGPDSNPDRHACGLTAHHLAYVIYTSGSTGAPKGAMNEHRAVVNRVMWMQEAYALEHSEVVLQKTPLSFDVSVWEVFWPLLSGACVQLAAPQGHKDPAYLKALMREGKITTLHFVPSMLRALVEHGDDARFPAIQRVICSGEALSPVLGARAQAMFPAAGIFNLYGPTEAAVDVTAWRYRADEAQETAASLPIGRPIANTQIYLLDAHGAPVPIGVMGEIHIGGDGVGRGYLNRDALTAERFLADPFSDIPDARMYRTGDLGRWRADGTIDFIGRNDHQVKIRGFRIELGEIEARLSAHDAVRACVVVALDDAASTDKRLVAYWVAAEGLASDGVCADSVDAQRLRDWLAATLPDYMVPAAYVQLEALPLTANGKLDRRALPAPDAGALVVQAYAAPQGELEIGLAALWRELLGVEQVGRHDSFFALGGHSLLGVRLISRIRSELGLELPLAALFAQPRLAELALALGDAGTTALPPILPLPRSAPLPLSFAQQRLWFVEQLDPRAARAYLIGGGVDLLGALNLPALRQALDRILARHEALRTCFVDHDDGATQVIAPPEVGFALECIDLRHAADAHAQAQHDSELEAQTAFDLTRGPLIRGRLLRLADEEHRLLVTMHHIVSDGWSMGLLVNELSTLYAAFAQGQPDPLPPLPIQYADYTLWQRRWLQGPVLQRQLDFWREHLHGAPALLELPTDRPRPPLQDYSGESVEFALDAELTSTLVALSQRHGTTVFMTVLAAWGVLLARLSGQDQAVIGTPVANRTRSELEPLIGFFVNTQALRVDLRERPSVAALLAQVRATALTAQDHQDLPFEHLIEALNPERSLSHHPVFQAMLTWQNNAAGALRLPGIRLQPIPTDRHDAKFDLELFMGQSEDRILGRLAYATALFDRSTIERQLAQFVQVLAAMAAEDRAAVHRLPLLPVEQRAQLQGFTSTDAAPIPARCIHHLFEDQVRRTPDAIALLEGEVQLSYAVLEARANHLAHRLHASGVGLESRVALYLPRGIDQVVALLATLKAGAAYLPLDPELPSERLTFLLEDSRPRAVLTCEALQDTLQASCAMLHVRVLTLDLDANLDRRDPGPPSVQDLCPDHLAYIIYTSGSTGQPKGTLLTHAGAAHYLQWAVHTYRPFPSAVVSSSLAFDATLTSLLAPLLCGARVELLPEYDTLDALRQRLCDATPLGLVKLTPAHLEVLGQQLADHPQPLSAKVMVIGGEALSSATLARWQTLAPHTRLINEYGPTETVVGCVVHEATAEDAHTAHGRVPIGRPIDQLRLYVLDPHGQLAPIGVAGHLHIAGPQLARGYLARPDLTADRFVPDPFAEQPGQRMYRSGDLACWRADGTLDYLGRNDDQVKLRGHRIELGDIAAALRACNGVQDAAVLLREDTPGERRLVAYLVGGAEHLAAEALRAQLATRLPEVMLPTAYVPLDALPLTPNGKLDRKAFPSPDASAYATNAHETPQGPVEEAIAAIWRDLLGLETIGRRDDFFALGGHSLLAVRVASRLRQDLGAEIGLADLFAHTTLEQLAACVASSSAAVLPPITPLASDAPPLLSFAQQRLWFLSQFEGVSEAYHISGGLRLHGVLDTSALQRALDRIVARHASLRTTFALVDGQAVQQIAAEDSGFQLMHHDLRDAPDREAALERRLTEAAQKPFALAQGPLIRGELMQLAETEHVLFVSMHHIVSDGWSMSILIDELSVLYRSFACNEADPLTPLPIQYADYALWQRQWLAGDVLQQQATYWRQALSGAPALLELPSDHPRPERQTYAGAQLDVLVDAEQVQALKALSQRHGMTLYMTLLASWAMLLSRLSGQGDVVIGSPAANRGRSETEGLIGFFVNTLALRIDLSGAPTLGQLLASVKTSALQAQAHQDIPFEQVVELVQPPRSLAHAPLFQVMFSWQNTPQGTLDLGELEVSELSVAQTSAKFDLSLSLEESEDGIVGNLTYATALFERATLERWLGHWRHLLDAMVSEGAEDRAVDRLSWLGEADRNQLLMEWNATAADYPRDACVHALFEAQVARDPLATAVVYGDVALSYGALNARANQLAYRLRALGVGLDDRVAICVQRSVEMVVAVLAVLKAGGAYVPLDPDYPQERLAYMLADCGAMMALTDTASRWRVEDTHAALVIVDLQADAEAWQHLPDRNPDRHASDVTARHLAYVIYTSGSTGTPKGVMIEHAGLTNYLSWAVRFYRPDTGALVSSSLAFDATITSLYVPLLCGARIELVPEQDKLEALHQRLCSNASPGLVKLTPAHLATLGQQLAAQPGAKPSATLFVIGGEALLTSTVTLWHERAPGMRLVNEYGPTETVVGCVAQDVSGPYRLDAYSQVPIGRPIGNMRIYILDVHSEPVPVGVVGQLHIAGVQMARGYRDRPALTAERFIADPFSGTPGARMYRSGDLGRWRADGTIEFVKRNDHQVKIRGFRIELGEIEARLGAHAAVRECVVVALEDAAGSGKRLVAYWVGAEGATSDGVDAEALRGWLAATLPEYMVPAAYVALEALPLTPNGKLDRKALPAPDGAAYATTAYEAPQGAIEEAITAIWCDLLGLDTIGRHDNFFTLGGHSLLAVTLTERMRRQGLQADLRTLFATPTLAALAAAIGSVSVRVPPNGITPDSAAIRPQMLPLVALTQAQIDAIVAMTPGGVANVQDIYPLAPLQEGIFFHHLLQREGDAYLLPHLIAFDSRARLDGFVAALQRVIDRHDILRTAVVWEGLVEPVQVVWRHAPLLIEEVQLEDADGDAATQLQSRFDPQHWRMDVRQAPLMRGFAAHDPASGQWLLSLLCHHLALDHTTLEIALEEVNSHLRGDADRLPAPQPFRHFVAQALLGVSRAEHEAYFRTLLGDVEEPCAPFGLLDVQGDGSTVEEAQRVLPEQLSALLRRQARTLGVSVASLFHLAWAQVVARATGRASAVFGTVLFGRMQGGAGADRTLGLFINTLPLRIEVDGTGVVDSVRVVQQRLAALLRHEHAPLSLAQQCSGVAAPAPLFTSLLNYRHSVEATDAVGSGSWEGIQTLSAQERTNYPLTVSVDDWGPGFTLKVHSQHPLVPARIVAFLEKALEELAEALAHAPETAVNALDVLPQAERDQVLRQWNATAADYPRDACVHELFEAQVARDPSAIAVTQAEVSLTYRELNARANRLAHYLRGLGVGPDDRVAICLERSVEMVVAVLAVLKAGGAYVPLDPHYPPERLSHMLADSGAVAVLTDMASRHLVEHRADAAVIVDLSANGERWAHGPDSNPDRHACGLTAHHLAYVIYTSGSTGAPKGAMNEHRAVVNRVMWMQEAYALEHSEVVLQKTPLSFDVSVWEVFWPLLSGACVQLAAPQGHKDPAYLKALMREGKITTLHFVPSMLRALVEHGDDARFPAIQRVICSGEALSPVLGARAQAMFPAAGIFNLYGPTEAAVDVTAWRYRADEAQETAASLPIGRPIANTQIYLLDAHGAPVPIGVMGEIHIGGDGVGRGYLNRDALTAERFLADPFSDIPDARMYRTGDLGRWRADGTIDFIGRNDHQVKIRGFRIELGEIEARLSAHDAVRACVVVALDDAASTDKRLVAYWVAAEGLASDGVCADSVDAQRLRDWLAATLPDYMVPAAYVQLEALPLTANGKLDRRALPAPDAGALVVQAYAAPQGELEIGLAALWRELLGVEQVGRHDSFFALGGHSLLGVRLISRIRSELGLELPLAALFAQPRLAELALALGDAGTTALPPILPVPRTEPMRLSFAQQRLWFLNQLDPRTGATYIMHGGVHLSGNLHVRALTRALDRIVARHETLRTHFANGEETPLQIIDAPRAVALQLIDLSGEPAPQSAARLHANNEANTGFDLANGPLFRGRLLRLAEREHVLLLSMHHIVSDGWSIGVLIEELGTLYAAFVQDQPDPLPPLPIQYADYAAWQHRWIDSQLQQRQLDFWCAQLRDAPALLELPTDRPRPPLQDTASDHVQVLLDETLSVRLQALAVQHGISIFGLLLAGWAALLSRYSGQTDLVIGTASAGRNRSELEPLIGFFVNTLPLRIDLSARPTFLELLDQVQATLLAAQANQDLPFERIIEAVRPVRSLSHTPLCQTMFSSDTTPARALELPDLQLSAYPSDHHVAQFDLSLDMQIAPTRIGGVLHYATALFERSTMQAYLDNYARLLAALADAPTLAVDRQVLLDADGWRSLQRWNDTARAVAPPTTIHTAFQAQARSTPDAMAVIDGDRTLRYAELDALSNHIALQLIAAGVRSGECVVTLLPRSADLVAAQLGILKAGATYVPLDPRQPAARHAQLAEDCQARAIVHAPGDAPSWATAPCLDIASTARPTDAFVAPPLPAAAPAYVMYTSGSSGKPKGVLVPHQAVLNLVRAPDYARWQADDRFAFASNPAFDSSTLEVWAPLLSGGSVVVVPQDVLLDPGLLADFARTHAISVLILVAGVLRAYASELARTLPTLRYLITGGDIADPQALATLLRGHRPHTLLQTYGPTETTQFVTAIGVSEVPEAGQRIPIGKPIGNLRLYVLDAHRQALPVGMQGELHIAGLGLAMGYLRQPGLTAEQFVPDPFSTVPGARMYRTGDLGRWRADGQLECLGRRDAQSKIRGFRLESGEIEAALRTHPQVDQALVRVCEDITGQRRLVAYVIGTQIDDSAAHDPNALRSHLADTLPDYMLPDAYVLMQTWPLTANGKLDARALPAPDDAQRGIAGIAPPQGETECALAEIWCALLGISTVNRHDNFFDIGGHSLLAVQLATRIQARLGRRLPLSRLFAEPTLARMAAALADSRVASSAPIATLVNRSNYYE
ncbi:hypothetical protein BVV10_11235 [Xanthomonas oryzae pv. oryzae]|uniref:non-ribosomal peptide synthase/polyketide synthase n=1 Tax=Xanthomonas oryzae TaxID=347 RepID=UPI000CA21F3C|nr:non-ribosomal peptide synthase/polyketide synthase [Xanthomonas oryzae]AUI90618.1 hypothetical protein BVV16_11215 [Xanthomonas oryzae pv. oryzae]AUI94295.1 hypothetical protein BVV17_11230 [Xanthomonas oryzae pv. oryzae]AUI97964.1 hypothetical protein BVV18_11230 [Xanthomonas oryzae pv. oryzae]AUJ01640.1 hypothetical protein BVV10_11235 [Xanthomonas oryzae pv. oryzae]AUJ16388.1 hypothetical protein BVV13_11225 [Xanthomonas oryzae pv. oryzae]